MSSYINFYIEKENSEEKELFLSYTRSNEIYNWFSENISIPYSYDENNEKYVELNKSNVNLVLRDIEDNIKKQKFRLKEYEKALMSASEKIELVEEIISQKDYIKEMERDYNKISVIYDILEDADYCNFKIYCNKE